MLKALRRLCRRDGCAPTVRELADACGVPKSAVHRALLALADRGKISLRFGAKRRQAWPSGLVRSGTNMGQRRKGLHASARGGHTMAG